MTPLDFSLERTVLIRARRETVFRFFTDPVRFARWWGEGSTIRAEEGGAVRIRYPGGETVSGEVREVVPATRVVFTYGYDTPGKPIPPGGSLVTITLEDVPEGTLVRLRHDVGDAATRDMHVPGWRFQLSLFAKVATDEQHAGADELVGRWFGAWNETDDARRRAILEASVTADVVMRDAYAAISGLEDLDAHIRATHMHFAGTRLERRGPVRHCQGTALVDWAGVGADGAVLMSGTNVVDFAAGGDRIARVVGIGAAPP